MSGGRDPASSADAPAAGGEPFGVRLRTAREQRQLTQEVVARQLRLDVGVIEALESDDWQHLPATIFVQGYVRSYARLLGLPEQELVAACTRQHEEPPPLTVRGVSGRRSAPRLPSARVIRNILLVLLAGIVLWFAYPQIERLLEGRLQDQGEEDTPGRLELPPAAR